MLNNIDIYPTTYEQQLIAKKAAQNNMSVHEFILFIIRSALTEDNCSSCKASK